MFTNKTKKRVAILLAGAIVLPGVVSESFVFAKAKCTVKKMTLEAGQKRTIKIKNKVKGAKYIFKSSKPLVAKVNAKGMVTAKKAGKAVITVVEKRKTKKKTKKKTIGRVKVMVKNVKDVTQSAEQSKEPVATAAVATEAAATVTPSGGMVSTATPATVVTASATPSETPSETPMATPLETAASKPKSPVDDRFEVPGEFDKEVKDYEYADPQTITYYSKVSEAKRKAVVYVPKDYDAAKEYPILYLLHGIGGDENEWKQGNPEVITGNLTREGKLPETIVVCPNQLVQVPGEKMPGNYLDPGRFVMFNRMIDELNTSLIPYMEEHYSIKEGRDNHAIAGLSMGGRTSLYCGFNMLDYFSYIGAFEPAPGVLPYSAEEGLFTEDTFKIPEEYQDTTLIMIQQGDKDNVVSDNPTKYHKALDKNGVRHLFNNVPYGHDWTAWKEGLYNFARRIFQ